MYHTGTLSREHCRYGPSVTVTETANWPLKCAALLGGSGSRVSIWRSSRSSRSVRRPQPGQLLLVAASCRGQQLAQLVAGSGGAGQQAQHQRGESAQRWLHGHVPAPVGHHLCRDAEVRPNYVIARLSNTANYPADQCMHACIWM